MNNTVRFSAVNTKIRLIQSRFLSDEDFRNLLHKKNVVEVAAYLKHETHYRIILGDINENEIHRRQLEVLIRKDHAEEIRKISHYFYDGYRKFFRYVFIKREIEDLKEILRGIENGRNFELDKGYFAHVGRFSKVNMDDLLSSRNINDFIKNMKGTIYYKYLASLEDKVDEKSLFLGEMVLDLAYFDIFYKYSSEISNNDRKTIDRLQGINADLLNIEWIYRGLMFYDLQPELLFNYTIPHGYELSIGDIKELCYSKNIEEFQDRVSRTKYSFLFDNASSRDIFMERRALRYQYFMVRSLESRHRMDISEALAFDILLEYEIRDIVSVIECIRYDIPEDEAVKFLIRKL